MLKPSSATVETPAKRYDVEMIRDFLDQLRWKSAANARKLEQPGQKHPELLAELRKFAEKYDAGLLLAWNLRRRLLERGVRGGARLSPQGTRRRPQVATRTSPRSGRSFGEACACAAPFERRPDRRSPARGRHAQEMAVNETRTCPECGQPLVVPHAASGRWSFAGLPQIGVVESGGWGARQSAGRTGVRREPPDVRDLAAARDARLDRALARRPTGGEVGQGRFRSARGGGRVRRSDVRQAARLERGEIDRRGLPRAGGCLFRQAGWAAGKEDGVDSSLSHPASPWAGPLS